MSIVLMCDTTYKYAQYVYTVPSIYFIIYIKYLVVKSLNIKLDHNPLLYKYNSQHLKRINTVHQSCPKTLSWDNFDELFSSTSNVDFYTSIHPFTYIKLHYFLYLEYHCPYLMVL